MAKNTNSNSYILIYSAVMVVIVATLLAVVSLSLQDKQAENILNDKKMSIMKSLFASKASDELSVEEVIEKENVQFDEYVKVYAIDQAGQEVVLDQDAKKNTEKVLNLLQDLKGSFAKNQFPVFETKDGRMVLPVDGVGLWGPIWGYVALGSDMDTVEGIIMDHQGETPGLGAEIATPKYQKKFQGQKIFEGEEFVSIELVKGGAPEGALHAVDAITGGTKTSAGVTNMLKESLSHYLPLLEAHRAALRAEAAQATPSEEVSNEEKVESNE